MRLHTRYMEGLIHGDCLDELKKISDNSVDLLCTDPPYGYHFMQKSWDKALPSVEIWKECLRVLKPGAFAFIMSAPRSDVLSRMIVRIEDAGFRVDFSPIYHTYASGFPKSANDNAFQRGKTERVNSHPTVKPLKLMSYLITLGSRPGDTVLDPFLGSGTTAIAAKKLGRKYIGIEREADYVKIAEARINAVQPTLLDAAE